ncbi:MULTISPECIES: DUF6807 domain-containing protein [Rhodococcus]|uniref:DUF6807 domain-containing protein n=1 Tax=Rhodococcus TaxID=1827 RepID=UPI00046CA5DD|nr:MULTISPECIES: PmoA family protein [Rhodococcus]PBC55867.1 oxidoreductase [Rhodococcus sp. ACPA1]UDG96959.1 PmoA family protein [Rhodococcus opacus PD630]
MTDTLATLRAGGIPVADYVSGFGLDPDLAPRPHLHPVRTLGGTPVTATRQPDHRWHLGVSVALQDVDGWNFWGGRSYLRGHGYTWRDDHGRIEHADFTELGDSGFAERLRWLTPRGEQLLAEYRQICARIVETGWELEVVTALTNTADRPVRLGSPATNGRVGAGYGGLFWRLPHPAGDVGVSTARAEGERGVHGSVAPWIAWTDHAADFTIVVAGIDDATRADPWFVRVEDYPAVGMQLAAVDPLTLPAGGTITRGFRALVADGVLDNSVANEWTAGA